MHHTSDKVLVHVQRSLPISCPSAKLLFGYYWSLWAFVTEKTKGDRQIFTKSWTLWPEDIGIWRRSMAIGVGHDDSTDSDEDESDGQSFPCRFLRCITFSPAFLLLWMNSSVLTCSVFFSAFPDHGFHCHYFFNCRTVHACGLTGGLVSVTACFQRTKLKERVGLGRTGCFVNVCDKSFIHFGHDWTAGGRVGVSQYAVASNISYINKTLWILTLCLWVIGSLGWRDLFSHHFRILTNSGQTTPNLKLWTPITLRKAINTNNPQESDKRIRKRIAFAIFELVKKTSMVNDFEMNYRWYHCPAYIGTSSIFL